MSEPSPQQMIQWFRSKAAEFNHIADSLELTFGPKGTFSYQTKAIRPRHRPSPAPLQNEASALTIREALKEKGYRVSGLAELFGVTESDIQDIIDAPDSGLEIGGRGWVRESDDDGQELL